MSLKQDPRALKHIGKVARLKDFNLNLLSNGRRRANPRPMTTLKGHVDRKPQGDAQIYSFAREKRGMQVRRYNFLK